MSYTTRGSIKRGFGFAIGWSLAQVVIGAVTGVIVAVWSVTGPARWPLRALVIAAGLAITVLVLSEM